MPLTDARLAELTVLVNGIEREIRQYHEAATDPQERETAFTILRQSVALRKPLEKWIASRACRPRARAS